jgi:hypothetical protein
MASQLQDSAGLLEHEDERVAQGDRVQASRLERQETWVQEQHGHVYHLCILGECSYAINWL